VGTWDGLRAARACAPPPYLHLRPVGCWLRYRATARQVKLAGPGASRRVARRVARKL